MGGTFVCDNSLNAYGPMCDLYTSSKLKFLTMEVFEHERDNSRPHWSWDINSFPITTF